MKKNWLLYLVIFSLALNVGTLGAFFYFRYQDRQAAVGRDLIRPVGLGKILRHLNLTPEQKQAFQQLFPAHQHQVMTMKKELAERRRDLVSLLQEDEPSLAALEDHLRRIGAIQTGLEREMLHFLLQVRQHLAPPQRQILLQQLNERLCSRRMHLGRPLRPEDLCPSPGRRGPGRELGGPGGPPPPPE